MYLAGALILRDKAYRRTFLVGGICIFIILNFNQQYSRFIRNTNLEKLQAYKNAQIWARDNTMPNSLFMLPPGPHTGWFDFAHRPTTGTIKTWLQDGWLYNSSYSLYKSGLERTSHFNLNAKDYTKRYSSLDGYRALLRDALKKYYNSEPAWYEGWAKNYKVDYFVFDNSMLSVTLPMNKVYENKYYSIYKFN